MSDKNCVVYCKASVRAVRLSNASAQQQHQHQWEQQHTWLQYLLANNCANKNDIIDLSEYDHKLIQNEHNDSNIYTGDGSILTRHHLFKNNSSIQCDKDFFSHFLQSAIAKSRGLLILDSDKRNNITIKTGYPEICKDEHLESRNTVTNGSKEDRSRLVVKKQYRLISLPLLVVLLGLISNQNALLCLGFDFPQRFYNTGFFGYNYPYQSPTTTPNMNNAPRDLQYRNFIREPMETMPTSLDSFTKDQNGVPLGSTEPNLSSWTSMLTSAFTGHQDTLDTHIKRILVPRVSGTQGNIQVREYIANTLKANDYYVELDEFTAPTPVGSVKFANIIASSNPNACRQLVLGCHYDSKMMDGFLGATDSAVPCAMLLRISETFNKSFHSSAGADSEGPENSLGLRLIFFDGEEAYVNWTPTDSLYGSRHLAEKWHKQPAPNQCSGKNELSRIELFVLLDLIGSSDTSFVMYNAQLKHHYNNMQKYEKSYLAKNGLTTQQIRRETAFKGRFVPLDFVEDDHVPFKQRGVPILSLLANPFPKVWHTINDNYSAIDFARTRRILHVIEEFVANYTKKAE